MPELSIHIDFPNGSMRRKMARLLDHIVRSGSIRQAATTMGVSNKHACDLVQAMADLLGGAVIITSAGGSGGGGSRLSKVGVAALQSYRRIETLLNGAVGAEPRSSHSSPEEISNIKTGLRKKVTRALNADSKKCTPQKGGIPRYNSSSPHANEGQMR
jgi:molybdate transport system regulatory protein